jgi:hypothetical protein
VLCKVNGASKSSVWNIILSDFFGKRFLNSGGIRWEKIIDRDQSDCIARELAQAKESLINNLGFPATLVAHVLASNL